MNRQTKDIATASLLIAIAAIWCGMVWQTIPPGTGHGDVGPRAFPLLLGVMLGLLGAGMLALALQRRADPATRAEAARRRADAVAAAQAYVRRDAGVRERSAPEAAARLAPAEAPMNSTPDAASSDAEEQAGRRAELIMLALTLGLLALYGFAMQKVGFTLATGLCVLAAMVLILRDRSVLRVGLMTVGITFGCWLLFGQILDIPLARGSWISLG
ncbi:MAG: tripartite tricarboxylate transporter TctB family protein [Celeribacter sp.]|jgi:Flp pilus assembly protein TadB